MPWHIEMQDNRHCVIKDTDGSVEKCHATEQEARAHMAALYANESDADKAITRQEGDGPHPASHYLVVEDAQKPSTWHLRVRGRDGKPDHRLMGAAWAALHGGYRGNKYEGPNKQEALAKLRRLYASEGLETPDSKATDQGGDKATLFTIEGEHTGLLIAVWLDEATARQLAVAGGEPPEALHLTLCYCGDANELPDVAIARAIAAVSETAMTWPPLSGQIAGLGRFNASESSDGKDVLYANVDVPGLERMREYLASSLDMAGCAPNRGHGYTPHITLAYLDEGADFPIQRIETMPFSIRSLWVSAGDRRTEIPLTGTNGLVGAPYKAGARHSRRDQHMLQTIHDHAVSLGAACSDAKHAADNALKAIGKTETELRVANYMVLFGGRDLEGVASPRVNADGSKGEFFTKNTVFDSPYTDLGFLYVDWEHGLAPDDEPGADEPLGYVDWKTAKIDDKGLFVERVLNRRNRYVQFIEDLFDEGIFGASSEAISGGVQKGRDGEIKTWPLRRDTITVQPMDPRQLSENTLAQIKTLSQRIPALKTLVNPATPHAQPEASAAETGGAPVERSAASGGKAIDSEAERLLLELELLTL
jgi:2'-5' RNA ligase